MLVSLEDNGLPPNHFELSLLRGNFFHLAGFGDIPSSHGDIPVVSYQLYEVESKKHIFSGSFIFLPIGSLANDAPSIRDASLLLYVLQDRILSWRETQSRMGFIDAIKLILSIPSVFHFQPYNDQYCSVNR